MHLLAATPGTLDETTDPVDLGQTPADIVFLSAADTELAALSEARSTWSDAPSLRLGNLTHLRHPMSVDLHLANCAVRSRLVIARVLGGTGYWRYGLEQYSAHLHDAGIPFVALPGDDKLDEELWGLSSIGRTNWENLWAYLVEGGPENALNFLKYARCLLPGALQDHPPAAKPLLRAGVYWPGEGVCDLDTVCTHWTEGAPVVPLVFYRALVQGAGLNPINRMVRELLRRGLNPLPVFVASLKDPLSAATLQRLLEAAPPDVILNFTAFAVGSHDPDAAVQTRDPLRAAEANGAPIFQVVLSGASEETWAEGLSGLGGRDIAMNVALPEVDGRVLTRAVSFKNEAYFDDATECAIAAYRARGDRIAFVADLCGALVGFAPNSRSRAQGRPGIGKLSQQGRTSGERRRARYARRDGACSAASCRGRV